MEVIKLPFCLENNDKVRTKFGKMPYNKVSNEKEGE